MWFNSLYRSISLHLERYDMYQIALLMMVICVIGFVLLRGFGSRSNY